VVAKEGLWSSSAMESADAMVTTAKAPSIRGMPAWSDRDLHFDNANHDSSADNFIWILH
jgi:hypothetical protein